MPALEVRNVSFAYPDGRVALRDLDLTIEAGERVAVLGPNGAGKTTLVLHLNGILRPRAGSIVVDGLTIADQDIGEIRRRVGIVFQDPDDQLFMPTVHDDVAFGPANLGLRGEALGHRVHDALDRVGMGGHAPRAPHHLSFGERRRVALATVLAMEPDVLVLDEPSSNLDPQARRELAEIVLALDVTTILVTHDLPYALQLCGRAVVLDGGRIVVDGPTREVLADRVTMAAHRLELPFGFDPSLRSPATQAAAARLPAGARSVASDEGRPASA
jgi:cobalt/nickel transport system ATP-binding protein